ncbi:pol polyprotein-like protein, partial [Leptotrombidium deliense]
LHTDGSKTGIGAALIQVCKITNNVFVIAYFSRILNASERNLSAIEIELLAIIAGIKRFYHYLIGRYFEIITDSNPLTFLMRTKNINSKHGRYAMFLQDFNFQIVYRKGSENQLCDLLSRKPLEISDNKDVYSFEQNEENENFNPLFFADFEIDSLSSLNAFMINSITETFNNISELQRNDNYLKNIFEILQGKVTGKNKSLRRKAFKYEIINGKLYRVVIENETFTNLLVIPKCLVNRILEIMHDCIMNGGHFGIRKTFERTRKRFYWKSMYSDVIKHVISCTKCQQNKPKLIKIGTLKPIKPGKRPFSKINVDIIGLLPRTKRDNRFIIVAACYLTKYVVTAAVKNVTAFDVATFLLNNIIFRFSVFDELVTDNGVQFRSDVIRELNLLFESTHRFSTPYSPTTSGLVERSNREINKLIRLYIEKDTSDWDSVLPYITFLYNTSYHSSTKYSPFYLVHGYEPKLPIDAVLNDNENMCRSSFVQNISGNLQTARNNAKTNITISQNKYKQNYDNKRNSFEFNVGDKCLVNYPTLHDNANKKYSNKWHGPFTIVHKLNDLNYEIEADDGCAYFDCIHINKLKPYIEREINKNCDSNANVNKARRSNRVRNIPKYLMDFYTGK